MFNDFLNCLRSIKLITYTFKYIHLKFFQLYDWPNAHIIFLQCDCEVEIKAAVFKLDLVMFSVNKTMRLAKIGVRFQVICKPPDL